MDVVAERTFEIDRDGERQDVLVKVGRPVIDEAGESWICTYEIVLGDECRADTSHGIDSMQALQLAISTLDVELKAKAESLGGKLYFLGEPISSVLEGGGFGL